MEARYSGIAAPRAARMQSAIRGLILAAIAGLVALGLSLGAAPATATFPGENGKIAFASDRTGSWEIWTMTSDGSNETKITHSPITSESQPSFSPNGKNILYVRAGELNCGLPSRPTCSREIFDDTTNWTPDGWKSFANAQPAYSPLMYGDYPQRRIVWSSHLRGRRDWLLHLDENQSPGLPDPAHELRGGRSSPVLLARWAANRL